MSETQFNSDLPGLQLQTKPVMAAANLQITMDLSLDQG